MSLPGRLQLLMQSMYKRHGLKSVAVRIVVTTKLEMILIRVSLVDFVVKTVGRV